LSTQNLRGSIGTINALAMCLGNLITNILGLPVLLGSDKLWPFLLGLRFFPAIVHIIGLITCIESPKHLFLTKNDEEKAIQVLEKLRNNNQIEIAYELDELKKEKAANQVLVSYMSLFTKPSLRRALIVSIV
jgi:hypothetical protein